MNGSRTLFVWPRVSAGTLKLYLEADGSVRVVNRYHGGLGEAIRHVWWFEHRGDVCFAALDGSASVHRDRDLAWVTDEMCRQLARDTEVVG